MMAQNKQQTKIIFFYLNFQSLKSDMFQTCNIHIA